jgi:hypothetical protein
MALDLLRLVGYKLCNFQTCVSGTRSVVVIIYVTQCSVVSIPRVSQAETI